MGKRRVILTIGVLATLLVAALGMVSAARRISAFQPLGASLTRAGGGWRVEAVQDPRTGLQPGDLIALVEAASPTSSDELARRLRATPSVGLLVLRADAPVEVEYRRPPLDIDLAYLLLVLSGATALTLGLYTLGRAPDQPGARLFFAWTLLTGTVYLVSHPPGFAFDTLAKTGYLAEELARLLLAPLTVHLFLTFPRGPRSASRWLPLLYAPAVALAIVQLDLVSGTRLFGAPAPSALALLDRLGLAHLALGGLAAVGILVHRLRKTPAAEPRRQLQWIAAGLAVGYLPFALIEVIPFVLDLRVPDPLRVVAVAPLSLVPLGFAWAILRYRLWDLGLFLRDGVAAAVTLVLGGSAFALLQLTLERHLPSALESSRPLLSAVVGLVTAGLLVPTQRTVRRRLERAIHVDRWDDRRGLDAIGRSLLSEHDPERLEASLAQAIHDGLGVEPIVLLLLDQGRLRDRERHFDLPAQAFDELWSQRVAPLRRGVPGASTAEPWDAVFAAGLRYALPLLTRDERIGFLLLGYRDQEIPLSSEDLDLVATVAAQASLALENARLLSSLGARLDEVRELRRQTEGIIASSPAGIALIDPHGTVLQVNDALRRVVAVDDPLGRPITEALPFELPAAGAGTTRVRFQDRAGATRHLEVSRSHTTVAEQSQDVLVVQDVGERVAMEQALEEKERLAALGMLAAGVAHEVNTPLTGISSYAQMLLARTAPDDDRYALLEKVERQTFRAARIVNDLLEFARDRRTPPRDLALPEVIAECVEMLGHRIEEQGVRVAVETPAGLPQVLGDSSELGQVFTNLFVNALDAMPNGGELVVTLEPVADQVVATVRDTGEGIAVADLERIFRPFFSTKLGRGGTGLGLAIAYQLVRRHGGEIRVASELSKGTEVTVSLPAAAA